MYTQEDDDWRVVESWYVDEGGLVWGGASFGVSDTIEIIKHLLKKQKDDQEQ